MSKGFVHFISDFIPRHVVQNATVKLVMMTSQNHMISEYALLELVKISVLMNVYIQKKNAGMCAAFCHHKFRFQIYIYYGIKVCRPV